MFISCDSLRVRTKFSRIPGGSPRGLLLHKPCIVLLELSWFPEIAEAGWKVLVGPDSERIATLIRTYEPTGPHRELFGDGYAHRKIVDALESRCLADQYVSQC